MPPRDWTSVPVTPETRDELKARKSGGEAYEAVIRRLLEAADDE